jgi:hypothetical protein
MSGEFAAKPEHRDLAWTVVAAHGDVGIQSRLVLAMPGDERDDPHRMLPRGSDGRSGGIGLVLLVREDEHGQDHAGGRGTHLVALGGDSSGNGPATRVFEPDHGRLQVRPSRAIMS